MEKLPARRSETSKSSLILSSIPSSVTLKSLEDHLFVYDKSWTSEEGYVIRGNKVSFSSLATALFQGWTMGDDGFLERRQSS